LRKVRECRREIVRKRKGEEAGNKNETVEITK
jgi:hypothetical protein